MHVRLELSGSCVGLAISAPRVRIQLEARRGKRTLPLNPLPRQKKKKLLKNKNINYKFNFNFNFII